MARPKKGQNGHVTSIVLYEEDQKILEQLRALGDGRSEGDIVREALRHCHHHLLDSNISDLLLEKRMEMIGQYRDRRRKILLEPKEYRKVQIQWVKSRYNELSSVLPGKSIEDIFLHLEQETSQSKEESK